MSANGTVKCPPPMKATSNGIFQGDDPLHFALPLLIIQICLVVLLTRGLAYLLRPLRQPRVIAEIIGGILLGPSALGRNKRYLNAIFPPRSLTVLDTLANLGLLFFLFFVGLELDLKALRRTGRKVLGIALAGITVPFALGIGTSFVLRATVSEGVSQGPFLVFMGVALSITAFPVLARILAELKLLTTDVGRMAMSAAAVNDVAAWILLALAIALSGTDHSPLVSIWVFLCGSGFVILCIFVAPPIFKWMARRCPRGEPVDEIYICATLAAVLAAGFVTDTIGIHALFGAFVIGVLVPKEGPFAGALVEKVEDLVSSLFLPLYFVSSGLKTNVATIQGAQSWGLLVLVILTACFGKIVGTVLVSLFCKIPFKEALTLGFLMNTKGLVELIVLNIGKDRGVLNDQTFAIMAFQHLSQVSVRPTTAISSMPSMHEDICDSAARKKVAMIILPFHKHQRLDGHLETTRAELRHMNKRVLEHAPCSVGILVDRGLGGASHISASNVDFTITTFFFGGRDDREALSYGALMAEHPGISLNASFVSKKIKGWFDQIQERMVNDAAEAVDVMRSYSRSNLVLVGRMPEGQLVASLNKKGECPELGPVGNLLISPEFSTSVLVVQQFCRQLSGDSLNSLMIEDTTEGESDSH
ncbi:hypothetical protein DH2020_028949 [Rehmannia glutinosa]|uniref:Cation/H+ exchanger domain-containing protein n=1 Tax=Rehmannia glutinosa TaxID=99300 RepID=A0ABR0VPZ3_REHGL